ncbi:sphingomyelin phosphodiesterase 4-like isoform X2 [Dendronephthya gigantea]|uniref:sphingomyelin phosphodiesterase 4-like isoform X2 n=1 Tax=Dendronephthya gigantea TaxID=151771 RepID=UPI00106CC3CE|nr:sphingomyelin phosphodiesterase 4-like isoform X2 [Dendronephthya gigantea]
MIRNRVEDFSAQKQIPRVGQEAMFLDQIHISLQKPIPERCEDVRKMVQEWNIKDLHVLYPHLLASIFSVTPGKGWALHTPHSRSLEAFRHFLGPHGPVWSLVEKLDRDSFLRYEFPVICLPKPTQRLFTEGIIPTMYYNKVSFNNDSRTSLVLSTGAVEYFLYQFAYFITQSSSPWDSTRAADRSHDTIYTALFSEFLEYFLPTQTVTLPAHSSGNRSQQQPKLTPRSNGVGEAVPPSYSGLIKSIDSRQTTAAGPSYEQYSIQARYSELFLQIFTEFWMNHGVDREGSQTFIPLGQEYFLPSVDHVRVVRMLVKHLHLFMNERMNNNNSAITSNNEFEEASYRNFMPESMKLFKKRLYWFIHHCFAHWPLDPTFRFILETWLSYIQPWRYMNSEQGSSPSRSSGRILFWKPFVRHNLLFYTMILQEFLNRAEKLNLRSSKDTQLFYRVTKVFSQEHLMSIIHEAEYELMSYLQSTQAGFIQKSRSPKPEQYHHFVEMQSPGAQYRPLWMEEIINDVRQLLHRVDEVLRSLREPRGNDVDRVKQDGGWFRTKIKNTLNWLQNAFAIDENYWLIQDESSSAQEHLTQVSRNLKKSFQIEDDVHESTIPWAADVDDSRSIPQRGSVEILPDCKKTERGLELTALGKYQMANGLRRFDIQYSGDPDLQPVRSFEIVFLVRALHKTSTLLNEKFGAHLSSIYTSHDWRGSIARYLSPGVKHPRALTPVKHVQHSVSDDTFGEAKISLRYLASYRLWAQLLLLYCFISWVLGRPCLACFVLVLVLLYMFVSNIHAVSGKGTRTRTNSDTWG